MAPFSIHPATGVGPVALTVADLDRSERFYCDIIGFKVLGRAGDTITFGADGATPLLAVTGQPGARRQPRTTGLYHFAILTPSRVALARSLRQLAEARWPISGASDHLVSEALYLDDPDGNGIEIYRDRPREEWPRQDGQIQMATDPLDIDSLIDELAHDASPWEGIAPDTIIGHVHLHVADLRAAQDFYHGVLGFDIIQRYGPSALFVSAGGYHHHIGLNTWAGMGAPPPPPGSVGLRWFDIRLPDATARDALLERIGAAGIATEEVAQGILLRDPSANGVVLTVAV